MSSASGAPAPTASAAAAPPAALPLTKIQAQGAAKAAFAALSFSIKDGRLKDVCVDLHQATWTSFENALATIRAVFRSATPPTELIVVQPRARCPGFGSNPTEKFLFCTGSCLSDPTNAGRTLPELPCRMRLGVHKREDGTWALINTAHRQDL